MTIRFFHATYGPVANAVTGLIIAVIFFYLSVANAGSFFLNQASFNGFFDWTAGILGNFYPTISFTGSFQSFAGSVAKDQLSNTAAFQMMPPANQAAALADATNQIETNFSKSLGVASAPTSSMSEVVYGAITNLLAKWRSRSGIWFSVGWGIAAFFLLRSVAVIGVWIGQFIAMIFYEIMLSAGIVHIKEEPRAQEVLDF